MYRQICTYIQMKCTQNCAYQIHSNTINIVFSGEVKWMSLRSKVNPSSRSYDQHLWGRDVENLEIPTTSTSSNMMVQDTCPNESIFEYNHNNHYKNKDNNGASNNDSCILYIYIYIMVLPGIVKS